MKLCNFTHLKSKDIQNFISENLKGIASTDFSNCDGCNEMIEEDTVIKGWAIGKFETKVEYTCCSKNVL